MSSILWTWGSSCHTTRRASSYWPSHLSRDSGNAGGQVHLQLVCNSFADHDMGSMVSIEDVPDQITTSLESQLREAVQDSRDYSRADDHPSHFMTSFRSVGAHCMASLDSLTMKLKMRKLPCRGLPPRFPFGSIAQLTRRAYCAART
jgi:hypothetical protein